MRANAKIDNHKRRLQKKKLWEDLTIGEMKGFLGVLFTMSIVKLPSFQMFWNKDHDYSMLQV